MKLLIDSLDPKISFKGKKASLVELQTVEQVIFVD
ncbi:MAG: hypothetical protein IPP46_02495 [Bacteroidetes bacterium]|nr:hypothetical protein [Bacteroidota bacterium]